MSDSGRQIGDCKHARTKSQCPECREPIDTAELRRIVEAIPDEIEMAALDGIGIEFRNIYNGIVLHPKKKYLQAIIDLCMMRTDIADEIDRLRVELAAANAKADRLADALREAIQQIRWNNQRPAWATAGPFIATLEAVYDAHRPSLNPPAESC